MHKIIIKRAGIEYKGILFESGLIELSDGHFSHIAHETGMHREVFKEVEKKEEPKVLAEEPIKEFSSSDKAKKRATKKA